MTNQYISIKDAMDLTGVSDPTLRRLGRKAKKHQKKYIDGKLHLLDSFLFNEYPPIQMTNQLTNHVTSQDEHPPIQDEQSRTEDKDPPVINEYILSLKKEIESKDRIIGELNERLRESNINFNQALKQLPQATTPTDNAYAKRKEKKSITEPLLISVALLSAIALIGFIGLMIYAYLTK